MNYSLIISKIILTIVFAIPLKSVFGNYFSTEFISNLISFILSGFITEIIYQLAKRFDKGANHPGYPNLTWTKISNMYVDALVIYILSVSLGVYFKVIDISIFGLGLTSLFFSLLFMVFLPAKFVSGINVVTKDKVRDIVFGIMLPLMALGVIVGLYMGISEVFF